MGFIKMGKKALHVRGKDKKTSPHASLELQSSIYIKDSTKQPSNTKHPKELNKSEITLKELCLPKMLELTPKSIHLFGNTVLEMLLEELLYLLKERRMKKTKKVLKKCIP